MPSISVRRLYQDNQHKLQLSWAGGTGGADNRIQESSERPVLALVGHLNFIHPNRVQVIGAEEYDFLSRLENGSMMKLSLEDLFDTEVAVIVVANDMPVPQLLLDYCDKHNVPLITSPVESPYLMDILRIYLQHALAVSVTKHGVFLDVFEVGVLILGQSGLGKSELALELLTRGHRLVADDAVELHRTAPEKLEGRCPQVLRDFLEVRGVGILNIRKMFGETAVRLTKSLQLIINLIPADDHYMKTVDRLNTLIEYDEILKVKIRKITIPVAVGRNLAVLVEAAVQNFILQQRGIDSTQEFLDRHTAVMKKDNIKNEIDAD
ncbi:MAG: HPr kinase/phosphorylase [Neisseriaceae bacterium]|nr:HPr kinase/phosphorylase [Neisseriaceae bacterium]